MAERLSSELLRSCGTHARPCAAAVTARLAQPTFLPACLPASPRVQIVMSAHKEQVLDEKTLHFRFGGTIVTGFSEPIQSSSFDSFEDFFSTLQAAWDKLWPEVFSADAAGGQGCHGGS